MPTILSGKFRFSGWFACFFVFLFNLDKTHNWKRKILSTKILETNNQKCFHYADIHSHTQSIWWMNGIIFDFTSLEQCCPTKPYWNGRACHNSTLFTIDFYSMWFFRLRCRITEKRGRVNGRWMKSGKEARREGERKIEKNEWKDRHRKDVVARRAKMYQKKTLEERRKGWNWKKKRKE